jgi:outer membrane protein insertion porin family
MLNLLKSIICYLFIVFFASNVHANDVFVKQVEFVGNSRISAETLYAYLEVVPNVSYSKEHLNEAVKRLYDTGFFKDVRISMENNKLVVYLEENPLINKIAIEGNKRIEDKDLLPELSSKVNTVFSQLKLNNDIQRIAALYEKMGRYSVHISAKKIELDQNRINLVFEVDEGKGTNIRQIRFLGNNNFSDRTLSDVIISKEYRFYRFFSSADVYDPEKLEYDKELLRTYYQNRGYAEFKVLSATAELNLERNAFILTYVLDEGIEYQFGELSVENQINDKNTTNFEEILGLGKGKRFSKKIVDEITDKLTNSLGSLGYPFIEIEPMLKPNKDTAIVDVKFFIKPSYKVYINKINIQKNTRTLDKVIRREMRIDEGDPYNINRIQRSKQRIENLGFFNKVDFKNKRTSSPDKVDIDVEVEEKSTGSINFAGGYNTVLGPIGQISLTENNFLGKGQQVQLGTTIAKKENGVNFSFTEPYLFDYNLSAGFDIFSTKRDFRSQSSFKSTNTGVVLRSGYEISERLSHGVRYMIKKETVSDVSPMASIYVRDEAGDRVQSSIGHTITYDALDSRITPTDGYLLKLDQDLAGVGGQTRFISTRGTAAFYKPIWEKDVVFKAVAKAGHIQGFGGKDVRLNDNFFLGPDYIRGFDIAGIGARDKKTRDALGGKRYATATTEIILPLGLPSEIGLRAAIFHDIGTLYNVDMKRTNTQINDSSAFRASAGISLIWNSPLGAINVHYGIPYMKQEFDDVRRFYIDFGTNF